MNVRRVSADHESPSSEYFAHVLEYYGVKEFFSTNRSKGILYLEVDSEKTARKEMSGLGGLQDLLMGGRLRGEGGGLGDIQQLDTSEQIYISSLALLKMLKHGR